MYFLLFNQTLRHLTNIPVWFGLLGDIKDGSM